MTRISLSMILNLSAALVLGLGIVWMSIERTHMRYELRRLGGERAELEALVDKLEIERNNMVSPANLRRMAERYNLRPILAGQMRRVGEPLAVAGAAPVVVLPTGKAAKGKAQSAVGAPKAAARQEPVAQAQKKPVQPAAAAKPAKGSH